jgi:uncharacterized protein (DUF2062 family)
MARKSKWFRRTRLVYLRQFPRRKHMHGGFLHRVLGESLFDKKLWKPDRTTVAAGMAIGLFIGLLPTYYIQLILAIVLAYLLKVNLSAAVVGTLVTNPVTTIPIVGLQFKLGVWLVGPPDPSDLERYHGVLRVVLGYGKPYLIGSIITATLAALIGYFAVVMFWSAGAKVVEVGHKHLDHHHHHKPPGGDAKVEGLPAKGDRPLEEAG